jgi:putative ABC transport system permease protein
MQLAEGRDFSRDIPGDTSTALLVNEAMVERMAWDEPIGKRFELGGPDGPLTYQVIGVVKDYHQNSLYDVIEPLMFFFGKNLHNVFIKLDTKDLKRSISGIENIWKEVYSDKPFEYVFLDEAFDEQYKADQKRGTLFTIFSGITIFIACLGLLGLASYTTEQRSKEIGIRKVIGASLSQVLVLLMREFVILTIIASILAAPLAYYFMGEWLESFAYRIVLTGELGTFALSMVVGVFITLLTVGFHAYRAATSNPVVSLKEE